MDSPLSYMHEASCAAACAAACVASSADLVLLPPLAQMLLKVPVHAPDALVTKQQPTTETSCQQQSTELDDHS